jgi:hypothetical protein
MSMVCLPYIDTNTEKGTDTKRTIRVDETSFIYWSSSTRTTMVGVSI